MKLMHTILFTGLLLGTAGVASAQVAAGAQDPSLNASPLKVIPVLVYVNNSGEITNVSPSTRLTPQYARLLRENLDQMISKPAMDHGKPISSQFVMNVALKVDPTSEGNYNARFVYVSAKPVPPGQWVWTHVNGHRLALENRNNIWNRNDSHRPPDHWQVPVQRNPSPTPAPAPPPGTQGAGRTG